jgi:NADPH:quinone reductase-like Zn-dependent oxidoreductase
MKAIVLAQYGSPDVLQFIEVEKPTPRDAEVFIRLYAASVNPLDLLDFWARIALAKHRQLSPQ